MPDNEPENVPDNENDKNDMNQAPQATPADCDAKRAPNVTVAVTGTSPSGADLSGGAADAGSRPSGQALLAPAEMRAMRRAGNMMSLSDLLWIPQAGVIAWLVAALLSGADGEAGQSAAKSLPVILAAAAVFLLLAFARLRLNLSAQTLALETGRGARTRLRRDLLAAFATASPSAPLPGSGEMAAHMGEQVEAVGPYLSNFMPQKVRLSIVPLGILFATACVSWLAALILLVAGPLIPVFMALIGLRAKAASLGQQKELTRMSGMLMDRLRGLETLRLFGAVERTRDEIEEAGTRFRIGTMKVLRIAFLSSTVLELFSALGIAFMAVFVGFSLLGDVTTGTWGAPLSFGAGLFILLLAPDFFAPLRAYSAAYHERAAGLAALETLAELNERLASAQSCEAATASARADSAAASPIGGGPGDRALGERNLSLPGAGVSLALEGVTLSLGGLRVLNDLSLRVNAGDHLLLSGPSGSGKTTLLDLLLGFHRPDRGRILVSGFDLESLDLDWWRDHVAWLGQAPVLFHGSLRANLRIADARAGDRDCLDALALAGCGELLARLPRGLDTPIGENGFGLSIGEQRRVALARAALRKDARLILADEPTAGLDRDTADAVIEGLMTLGRDRTLLIATHDEALLDRGLPVLEFGRLEASVPPVDDDTQGRDA